MAERIIAHPEHPELDVEGNPLLIQAPRGRLQRLCAAMPASLQAQVGELLQLYALNGVPDARAASAVSELFSPPRVTKELRKMLRRVPGMGLVPGSTFDLQEDEHGEAYNVLLAEDRARIRARIERDEPFLVVVSPDCRGWGSFNEDTNFQKMSPEAVRRRLVEREVCIRFAAELYRHQLARGRRFLHEHPARASS